MKAVMSVESLVGWMAALKVATKAVMLAVYSVFRMVV